MVFNIWEFFKFAELTEVRRQKHLARFIRFLNKMRFWNIDENVQKHIKARFIKEFDTNYPENAMYMLVENYLTVKHNRKIRDELQGKMYIIKRIYQIPAGRKYLKTLLSLADIEKQSDMRGFPN